MPGIWEKRPGDAPSQKRLTMRRRQKCRDRGLLLSHSPLPLCCCGLYVGMNCFHHNLDYSIIKSVEIYQQTSFVHHKGGLVYSGHNRLP